MNELENKHGDFERCHRNFCEAAAELSSAVYGRSIEDAKWLHHLLMPVHQRITAIRDDIRTANRTHWMAEIAKRMPNEGDRAVVDICPCPDGDCETWMVSGRVLKAWFTDKPAKDAVWALIEVTRPLTHEENDGWQTDESWNGCAFVCRLSYDAADWRAMWPANDRAREQWHCE